MLNDKKSNPGYYDASRSLGISMAAILPLILLYQWGILSSGHQVRNLAEIWLAGPLELLGLEAAHALNIAVVLALLAVMWRSDHAEVSGLLIVMVMIAEALLYALLLHRGSFLLADLLYDHTRQVFFRINLNFNLARPHELTLALGAGVYEELLFRLLLLGGGAWAMEKLFHWNGGLCLALALIVSSALFSAAHYVGPLGETPDAYSFLFRMVCGGLLGLIYVFRGIGVTVWTHALYNGLIVLTAS